MESKRRVVWGQIIPTSIVGICVLLFLSDQEGRKEIFRWLGLAHNYVYGVILAIAAVYNIRAWIQRKFWCPAYVHVLAIASYGFCLLALGGFDLKRGLFSLVLPCFVYVAFVAYGGVEAAAQRRDQIESERENLTPR